jgi:hypothetical protein
MEMELNDDGDDGRGNPNFVYQSHSSSTNINFAFKCKICPSSFSRREGYLHHKKGHSENYDFACEMCNYTCTSQLGLTRHRKIHKLQKHIRQGSFSASSNPVAGKYPVNY